MKQITVEMYSLQFWRPGIWYQGVNKVLWRCLKALEENASLPLLASGGCQQCLAFLVAAELWPVPANTWIRSHHKHWGSDLNRALWETQLNTLQSSNSILMAKSKILKDVKTSNHPEAVLDIREGSKYTSSILAMWTFLKRGGSHPSAWWSLLDPYGISIQAKDTKTHPRDWEDYLRRATEVGICLYLWFRSTHENKNTD